MSTSSTEIAERTPPPANTDVATVDGVRGTIATFIKNLEPELARALPKNMDVDRITRLALTVIRQSDIEARKAEKPQNSLANCTPESFAGALLTSSALGLEPGINGEAWLVPYKGECTLIVGYQGFVKLFWQHPLARHIDSHAVHERDSFDYAYGIAQYLRHKPADGDRGKIAHYYAVAELATGGSSFVVLTADEVKDLRGGSVGPSGRIKDPQHWMERKTAVRQLFKLLPKSVHLAAAIAVDEQTGTILAQRGIPSAISTGDGFPALPPPPHFEAAAADQAERVTAADILRTPDTARPANVTDQGELIPDPANNCPTCGMPDTEPCDSEMHADANVPVRS